MALSRLHSNTPRVSLCGEWSQSRASPPPDLRPAHAHWTTVPRSPRPSLLLLLTPSLAGCVVVLSQAPRVCCVRSSPLLLGTRVVTSLAMRSLSLLLLAVLALLGCTLVVDARNPSRTCRICEDVAQTYHDAYRCAGEDVDLWGPGDAPSIPACDQAKFACDKLTGDLSQACATMESSFMEDNELARSLWTSQMEFGRPYDTCVKMGKCERDPNRFEEELTPCHQVFNSVEGQHDPLLPAFTASCTEECYLCTWLVREWPLFQEICTPEGTRLPNSIDPDREIVVQNAEASLEAAAEAEQQEAQQEAFLERQHQQELQAEHAGYTPAPLAQRIIRRGEDDALMRRTYAAAPMQSHGSDAGADEVFLEESIDMRSNSRSRAQAQTQSHAKGMARAWSKATTRAIHGVLSAHSRPNKDLLYSTPGDDETGPTMSESSMQQDCFTMWRYFARSRKAKFFASWKRNIGMERTPADVERSNNWDANVVCKCLGQCDLDPFEHLGLIKACRYDDKDRTAMDFAFPNPK